MSVSDGAIIPCPPSELPGLLEEIDAEFIFKKGRSRRLAERFPRLFAPGNLGNVLVLRAEGSVVAAAASQPFTFVDMGVRWRCARIGAVWTHPSFRGKGLASAVLRALAEVNAAERVEALVLWTSLHRFYGRLGWRLDDLGLFGSVVNRDGPGDSVEPTPRAIGECDVARLDEIRQRHLTRFVERNPMDWRALPVPATSVDAFVSDEAYALVGTVSDTGYVYEFVGEQSAFGRVWAAIRARYTRVFVNESEGRTATWLREQGGAQFTPQQLAMWMPLSPDAEALGGRLFVPYLDRI